MGKVSIPYSSGQCFFSKKENPYGKKAGGVSIPYSSGQCFFSEDLQNFLDGKLSCFNPLFIRSVFLLWAALTAFTLMKKFQSLIHQVSVSFRRDNNAEM